MLSSDKLIVPCGLAVLTYAILSVRRYFLLADVKEVANANCDPQDSNCGVPGDGDTAYLFVNLAENMKIGDIFLSIVVLVLGLLFLGNREGRA